MFANVQDDYNLRIIDFGLAEQLEENTDHVVSILTTVTVQSTRWQQAIIPPASSESLITFIFWYIIIL